MLIGSVLMVILAFSTLFDAIPSEALALTTLLYAALAIAAAIYIQSEAMKAVAASKSSDSRLRHAFDVIGHAESAALLAASTMASDLADGQGEAANAAGIVGILEENAKGIVTNTEQMSHTINAVAAAAEQISTNINAVASTSEQISSTMLAVATTSEEMSVNLGSVDQAMREMSSSINAIAENTREGAGVAYSASEAAGATGQIMTDLRQSAEEIGKVTGVIQVIAQQTNLLALNAAIEAASAGEAGRGFAVVANEVKELAKQTTTATEDIAAKIQMIQNKTDKAVAAIAHIVEIIGRINDLQGLISRAVDQQQEASGSISKNVTEAAAGVNEISRNINESAHGANAVSRGIGEIASGANEVAGNVAAAAAGVSEINEATVEASVMVTEANRYIMRTAEATTSCMAGVGDVNQAVESIAEAVASIEARS